MKNTSVLMGLAGSLALLSLVSVRPGVTTGEEERTMHSVVLLTAEVNQVLQHTVV